MVMDSITDEVATLGFEPPIRPGFIEPVELYLATTTTKTILKLIRILKVDNDKKK